MGALKPRGESSRGTPPKRMGQRRVQNERNDDSKLIRNAQRDSREYDKLYRKYAVFVYGYLWNRVGRSKEVAEDLMQETFLRAFRGLNRFRYKGFSYFTYLARIAHNLLVNYYRKPKDAPLTALKQELQSDEKGADQALDTQFQVEALEDGIVQLPEKEKLVLLRFYKEGRSIREIAQEMGKSENAAKLLLSRARKRLAKLLTEK